MLFSSLRRFADRRRRMRSKNLPLPARLKQRVDGEAI
jgi:hypothetical protein